MPSNIPAARARLEALVASHHTPYTVRLELRRALAEMVRVRTKKCTATDNTVVPVTSELAAEIREFAQANPLWSTLRVARKFRVNPGRVSEAIAGLR